jgi:hypothetical protein
VKSIFFLLFLVSCATTISKDYIPSQGCVSGISRDDLSKDKRAWILGHTLVSYDLSQEEIKKVSTAIALLKRVVSTEEFRQAVLGHTWQGSKQFAYTAMTNEAVYEAIMEGSEDFATTKDGVMDFHVSKFTEDNETVAYTRWGLNMIYLNTKYSYHSVPRLSDTLMHEWLHKLGFRHPEDRTGNRDYSVPYAIGDIVHRIAINYYDCSNE